MFGLLLEHQGLLSQAEKAYDRFVIKIDWKITDVGLLNLAVRTTAFI